MFLSYLILDCKKLKIVKNNNIGKDIKIIKNV